MELGTEDLFSEEQPRHPQQGKMARLLHNSTLRPALLALALVSASVGASVEITNDAVAQFLPNIISGTTAKMVVDLDEKADTKCREEGRDGLDDFIEKDRTPRLNHDGFTDESRQYCKAKRLVQGSTTELSGYIAFGRASGRIPLTIMLTEHDGSSATFVGVPFSIPIGRDNDPLVIPFLSTGPVRVPFNQEEDLAGEDVITIVAKDPAQK
ncbi:MAG: hypothetical protein WC897_03120 [Candidatus Gracilibacteria bacterium]